MINLHTIRLTSLHGNLPGQSNKPVNPGFLDINTFLKKKKPPEGGSKV